MRHLTVRTFAMILAILFSFAIFSTTFAKTTSEGNNGSSLEQIEKKSEKKKKLKKKKKARKEKKTNKEKGKKAKKGTEGRKEREKSRRERGGSLLNRHTVSSKEPQQQLPLRGAVFF